MKSESSNPSNSLRPDKDILLFERGIALLERQLDKAKADLIALEKLKARVQTNANAFIDDLFNHRLDIPVRQDIVQVPSLEWVLAHPRHFEHPVDEQDMFDRAPAQAFHGYSLSPLPDPDVALNYDKDTITQVRNVLEYEIAGEPPSNPTSELGDDAQSVLPPLSAISSLASASSPPLFSETGELPDRAAERKRKRAERERERRRRKKEATQGPMSVTASNNLATVNLPISSGDRNRTEYRSVRVSGGKYLTSATMLPKRAGKEHHLEEDVVHHGYQCDSCKVEPILGPRYTCTECPEQDPTDLCKKCYSLKRYTSMYHTLQHRFIAVEQAESLNDDYSYLGM